MGLKGSGSDETLLAYPQDTRPHEGQKHRRRERESLTLEPKEASCKTHERQENTCCKEEHQSPNGPDGDTKSRKKLGVPSPKDVLWENQKNPDTQRSKTEPDQEPLKRGVVESQEEKPKESDREGASIRKLSVTHITEGKIA